MKANKVLFSLCLLIGGFFGAISLNALDASVSLAQFRNGQQPYAEIHLHVIGQSVVFVKTADSLHYQASVEVVMMLQSGTQIERVEKYVLHSPMSQQIVDFIDLKRFPLQSGAYELSIEVRDLNKDENVFRYSKSIHTDEASAAFTQSDIQLFAACREAVSEHAFTKNGIEFEPLPYHYYHEQYDQLILYSELYGSDATFSQDFYVSAYIYRDYFGENGKRVLQKHKKMKPQAVNPLLMNVDISKLISGNYHIVLEVHHSDKTLVSSKHANFQRYNPDGDRKHRRNYNRVFENSFVQKIPTEDLDYMLKAHSALVTENRGGILDGLVDEGSEISKRHFIFTYWTEHNPRKPEAAFLEHMERVREADQLFHSNVGYGFETDRGYIYLRYGTPDDIIAEDQEPSAPPYEIWIYNYLERTQQTGVKFLFYNPSLSHNDYQLLHSTCRTERNNPRWEVELYRHAPDEQIGDPINGTEMQDNWQRNARRYFNDF